MKAQRARALLDTDEVTEVLQASFYGNADRALEERSTHDRSRAARPEHYKVICISLYNDDLANLDRMVEELKARGFTRANRSALIRFALGSVDLDRVPRGL